MNSPDDDRPPPVPPRDPLLDDPLFAEIVEPKSPKPVEPVYAEPVEAADAGELPVAELAPVVARPKAVPVPATFPPKPPAHKPMPPLPPTVEVRPQWYAACGVIGCLGILVIGAVALLLWIAITLLGGLGDQLDKEKNKKEPASTNSTNRPGPIAPTQLAKNDTIKLPGTVSATALGGGGRYLLLGIPSRKEISAFDPNTGSLVRTYAMDETNASFAATASKLFVLNRVGGKIVRYDLETGEREHEAPVPKGLPAIDALSAGPGSDGPLYAFTAPPNAPVQIHVLRTDTLELSTTQTIKEWKGQADRLVLPQCTFDGEQVGVAGSDSAYAVRPLPVGRVKEKSQAAALRSLSRSSLLATPSPDGMYFYTPRGIFDPEGSRLSGSGNFTFPTAHGSGLYLSLQVEDDQVTGSPRLHAAGDDSNQPLASLDEIELTGDLPAYELRALSLPSNQRVHVWPVAGLVAVIPYSNNELQLFKLDITKVLDGASRDFVAFATDPPPAREGVAWRYTPRLWSRRGSKPTLELESGPAGMRLERDTLVWMPQSAATSEVRLRARVRGKVAKQVFQPVVLPRP